MIKKFTSDIDIDFGDRSQILSKIKHIPASILRNDQLIKHNTGVYFTKIPVDPFTGYASVDHEKAEELGYIKLDFLNVSLYNKIENEKQLEILLHKEPDWQNLYNKQFCEQLIHIGNHFDILTQMPEPVDSIPRMAMLLSIIRPAKRHLVGKTWEEIAKTVWERPIDNTYYFKKSHAVAYAHLVVVHMNLLDNFSN